MKLLYREYGSGRSLILLHGLFGSSDNWVTFARQLSSENNLRVIVPDLRNHGQSPHHPVFSFESMVEDLFELMADLKLEKPMVLGHSLGGKIILKSLLEQPDAFSKIIIADMGLRQYSPRYGHVEILELMQNHDLSQYTTRKEVEQLVAKHIHDLRLQLFVLKNVYWKNKETLGWKVNVEAISNYLPDIFSGVVYQKPNNTPILFLKGALSDYINEKDRELIKANFTNSTVIEIPEAGHWLHVDNANAFYAGVKRMI